MSKPLTGDDAAVLAVLAQAKKMPTSEQRKLIDELHGEAKSIGKALIGENSSKSAKKSAGAFKDWADGLGPANKQPK